jgi:hypothetical protein
MSLLQLLDKAEAGADPEFLRDGLRLLVQELMDAEVTHLVGAGPYERTDTRLTQRNGYREREWDTRGRDDGAADPQAAPGDLLPGTFGAAPAARAGAALGGAAGLRPLVLSLQLLEPLALRRVHRVLDGTANALQTLD